MIGDKIKKLRQSQNLTQSAVAKKLGITRSSVNAWEMGISIPSTQYVVELSKLFNVSSDYLLDISQNASIIVFRYKKREDLSILYYFIKILTYTKLIFCISGVRLKYIKNIITKIFSKNF